MTAGTSNTTMHLEDNPMSWNVTANQQSGTFRFTDSDRGIGLMNGSTVKNYSLTNDKNSSYTFDIYLFANSCQHTNTHEVRVEPTCTTDGYVDVICSDCGKTISHTVLPKGHKLVELSRTDATCTEAGVIHYECSICHEKIDEKIDPLGHDYVIKTVEPTCTEDGYTLTTCKREGCNLHEVTDTVPALGHDWVLTEEGANNGEYDLYTCSRCHETKKVYNRTISFVVPNGITAIDPIAAKDGDKIVLPEPVGTPTATDEDYIFVGWAASSVEDATDAQYLDAGTEYTADSNVTFHALYAYLGGESTGDELTYQHITDANRLDTGWQLAIVSSGYKTNMAMGKDYTISGKSFDGRAVTVAGEQVTLNDTVQTFTVVKNEDGTFCLISDNWFDEDAEKNPLDCYLTCCSDNKNEVDVIAYPDGVTDAAKWNITIGADGNAKMTAGKFERNTVLFNSTNGGLFSCYGETYLGSEGQVANVYPVRIFASNCVYHYTTELKQTCTHPSMTWTDNGDGTCTGKCNDCTYEVTQDHVYGEDVVVTAPTCTENGQGTRTCLNCGHVEEFTIEPLGHDYIETVTQEPTCTVEGKMVVTCSRCDYSEEKSIPCIPHNFVNGECTMCHAKAYSRVENAPDNWEGEYMIVYEADAQNAYAFDGKNDNANNFVTGTVVGENMISVPDAVPYTITVEAAEDGYHIKNSEGKYFSYTDNKNGFGVGNVPALYTIELTADNGVIIKNTNGAVLRFNLNNQGSMFRFYKTTSYSSMKAVQLYEKAGTCHHDWVETNRVDATCEKTGVIEYTCSICQETKLEEIPALGHDWEVVRTVAPTCTEDGYTEVKCKRCGATDVIDIIPAEGHKFTIDPSKDDAEHYIAPTCTEDGLIYRQCSVCGAWDTVGEIIPATGHNYVDGVCTNCGKQLDSKVFTLKTENTDFTDVSDVLMVIEPEKGVFYSMSATEDGSLLVGDAVNVVDKTITIYPEDGTHTIFAPAMNISDGANIGTGFYTADGYLHVNTKGLKVTTTTGNSALAFAPAEVWNGKYEGNDQPVMVPVKNAWFVKGLASNMYIGNPDGTTGFNVEDDTFYAVPVYFYVVNGSSVIDPPAEPHEHADEVDHVLEIPATCTEAGQKEYYTCHHYDCPCYGKYYEDRELTKEITDLTIAPLGHDYVYVVHEPTCTEEGYTEVTCSRCDYSDMKDIVPALGHAWGEVVYQWNEDHTTCTATRTCTREGCNVSEEAVGVISEEVTKEATETETGEITYTATFDAPWAVTQTEAVTTPKLEPTGPVVDDNIVVGSSLKLQSDLTMRFRIRENRLTNYDLSTAYMVVERDMYPSGEPMFVKTQTITEYAIEGGRVIFAYPGISAAQMNDEIRATLYIKDGSGKLYASPVLVTSVTEYCNGLLEYQGDQDPGLCKVLMSMLNYGTAAQLHFDRHTDAPANQAYPIFDQYRSYAPAELEQPLADLYASKPLTGATAKISISLELATKIGITYKVTLPQGTDLSKAVVVVKAADGTELERLPLEGSETDSRGRHVVKYYGNKAMQMRDIVDAVVLLDGVEISNTYSYSISTYAYESTLGGTAADLVELAKRMVIYGDAAKAYFG